MLNKTKATIVGIECSDTKGIVGIQLRHDQPIQKGDIIMGKTKNPVLTKEEAHIILMMLEGRSVDFKLYKSALQKLQQIAQG